MILEQDIYDLAIMRKKLYECFEHYYKKDFHFENDDDYDFFINNIAKQGVPIYYFWVNELEDNYKSTVRIRIRYQGSTQIWIDAIDLVSTNKKFKLPKFEIDYKKFKEVE